MVQSTVVPHFAIFGLKVELVLLLVVAWSILRGPEEGVVWAVIGGFLLDLFSAAPFGISATVMALTALLVSWVGPSLLRANSLLPLVLVPVATAIFNVLSLTLLEAFGWNANWPFVLSEVVLPLAVLNTFVAIPVYGLLFSVNSRLQPPLSF